MQRRRTHACAAISLKSNVLIGVACAIVLCIATDYAVKRRSAKRRRTGARYAFTDLFIREERKQNFAFFPDQAEKSPTCILLAFF